MSQPTRLGLTLLAAHLLLALAAYPAVRAEPWLLLPLEALFVVSLAVSWRAVRSLGATRELARVGADLLADADFTTQLRPVGQADADLLVEVYNRMAAALRNERLRLEERELFLGRLLAASPAGVLTLDLDRRLTDVNPAALRLLGVEREELLGRPLATSTHPLFAELALLPPGQRMVLGLGGRRRLRVQHGEFSDRGFRRSFYLLEELTEELRASEKQAYERLVRLVAHEVNNSVGAVRSLLDSCRAMLAESTATEASPASVPAPALSEAPATAATAGPLGEVDTALAVAATRLLHLARFVEGFAAIVRLPAPERRPLDLAALLDHLLVLLRGELDRHRVTVHWQRRDPAPPLAADPAQLEQVLLNVLKNAIEASSEAGASPANPATAIHPRPIELAVERTANGPAGSAGGSLRIRDHGPGVPPEAMARLFTPFFTTKPGGRGLGLTLTAEVLDAHGLRYSLTNHPDGGAEFTLSW
jgi:two-component system nitrogen regulation sensor histidine kinase NtrY